VESDAGVHAINLVGQLDVPKRGAADRDVAGRRPELVQAVLGDVFHLDGVVVADLDLVGGGDVGRRRRVG
jgi:hypothetical protein